MTTKKYDLVVFGASGHTGQYVVDEVARAADEEGFTWAVAGRNMAKLQKTLREASTRTGLKLEETPVIIADTGSSASLEEMAKQVKVVLNCVGPFRFSGEQVVKACVTGGAHYLDISGEPQFLETMQLRYDKPARENNVCVIGSAGFDSVPAEMCLLYMLDKFKSGELTGVESYITLHYGPKGGGANFATYESAVYGLGDAKSLHKVRKELFTERLPKPEHKLPRRSALFFGDAVGKWSVPFIGSDKSVVNRTIRDHMKRGALKRNIEFSPYLTLPNLFYGVCFIVFALLFSFMCKFSFGRYLLLTYPTIFTLGFCRGAGPNKEQIDDTTFSVTFVGRGFDTPDAASSGQKPNRQVMARMTGPEAGYASTPICLVQCAMILLKESDKLYHQSGVHTPGSMFPFDSLLRRLDAHNLKTVTISDKTK